MRFKHAAGLAAMLALGAPALATAAGPPAPVDPQNWTFQDNFTWNDYHPIPGKDYSDPSIVPSVSCTGLPTCTCSRCRPGCGNSLARATPMRTGSPSHALA